MTFQPSRSRSANMLSSFFRQLLDPCSRRFRSQWPSRSRRRAKQVPAKSRHRSRPAGRLDLEQLEIRLTPSVTLYPIAGGTPLQSVSFSESSALQAFLVSNGTLQLFYSD